MMMTKSIQVKNVTMLSGHIFPSISHLNIDLILFCISVTEEI